MKFPPEDASSGKLRAPLLSDRPSSLFSPHWTTEDRCLLALLFETRKAGALPSNRRETISRHQQCDWPRLIDKARREGVAAALFHNLTQAHMEVVFPQEILTALSDDYYSTLKRNLSIIGKLRIILAAFQETGIPCIVLKGIALAEHIYPSIGMRGMADVDILVRKEQLFEADALLLSLGYEPKDSVAETAINNPEGYLASLEYRGKVSPLNLHVHWHTVNTSVPATMFIELVDIERLWEQAVPTNVADSHALTLRPEHAIIYLCEHALRIGHSFDRLILICDIFYSLKAFATVMDWDFLVEESRRFNLSRLVYCGLAIVRHYTRIDISEDWMAKLRPTDLFWGERFFLRLQFGNRRIRGSSYLLYLAMNRRLSDKARFIFRTFFPPRPILLQRRYLKESQGTGGLYLSRLHEILSHLWGQNSFYRRGGS
jgi:hypothetical protein